MTKASEKQANQDAEVLSRPEGDPAVQQTTEVTAPVATAAGGFGAGTESVATQHDTLSHEELVAAGHGYDLTDEEKRALRLTGALPPGVSYSPKSATPFVRFPQEAAEKQLAAMRQIVPVAGRG